MLMFLKPLELPSFWLPQGREGEKRAGQLPPQQREGGGGSGLTSGRWSEEKKKLLDVLGKCFSYWAIGCEARALVGTVCRWMFGCGSWARCQRLRDFTKVTRPSCLSSSQQSSGSNFGSHSPAYSIFLMAVSAVGSHVLFWAWGEWRLLDFALPKAYEVI